MKAFFLRNFFIFVLCFMVKRASGQFDIPDVPEMLLTPQFEKFKNQYEQLNAELSALQELVKSFNAACTGKKIPEEDTRLINQCTEMSSRIDKEGDALAGKISSYAQELDKAIEERIKQIKQNFKELAQTLGWSKEEITRLDRALESLDADGDTTVTRLQVAETWSRIKTRGEDPDLADKAKSARGHSFPGAGHQSGDDCAVFALANAAGLPYSVVAARAIKLIQEGKWREDKYRNNPQRVFDEGGLSGGEVIMLTEAFGKVEVVKSAELIKTLKQGNPVMINAVPYNGNFNSGHEVVLTKTFSHKGENWFEMIDSNREGLWQRLFLNSKELQTILKENGVVYRPEKGTVPGLLHKE